MSTSNSLNTPIIWNKGLAGRRRGVDRLLMETEVDPGAADLAEETDKVEFGHRAVPGTHFVTPANLAYA